MKMNKFKGLTVAATTLLGAALGSALAATTIQGTIGFWSG